VSFLPHSRPHQETRASGGTTARLSESAGLARLALARCVFYLASSMSMSLSFVSPPCAFAPGRVVFG